MRRVGQVRSWVPTGPLTGFVCLLALLGVLATTTGLDASGWLAGVACGAGLAALLARALTRHSQAGLGPADSVTLARAVLACGVAALTVDSFGGQAPVAVLVALSTVALVLDAVDGRVARRTYTISAFGARFDMEVDAFLIMVLSVYVARESGWWVLAMGLARYVFVAAGWVLPWLRGPLPPRQWARVVAAIVGVVLTVAAADILPVGDVHVRVARVSFSGELAFEVNVKGWHGEDADIGVGTVTNGEQVAAAVDAGAHYLVTPITDPALVDAANRAAVPIVPGGLTPTELFAAWSAGAAAVKIFPANQVGPGYLNDLRGPFPGIAAVPSGGVDLLGAEAWLQAGAAAVSVGGPLLGDALRGGDLDALRDRATAFVATCSQVTT